MFLEVVEILKEYNIKIDENNNIGDNIVIKKQELNLKVWNVIVGNLNIEIEKYNEKISRLSKMKDGINSEIRQGEEDIKKYVSIIKEKEASITSITPTIDKINKILISFGFNGFRLETAMENGYYKITRNDGKDVDDTLSEGEYRFITFLYFYQLIKGSNESSGITRDKIIVIDDPISSLDSNVLFIVSTLVKDIIKACIDKFEGEEKLLCKSLISFINNGSHLISDDLVLCLEADEIERYLEVFKFVFRNMGHESHYNMMKKIVNE